MSQKHDLLETVILVHGIRSHGEWYDGLRFALEDAGHVVCFIKYGRFATLRFLLPIRLFRMAAVERLYRQIRMCFFINKTQRTHIITHSFESYLVSRILQDEFDLKINRVIFIGSVVRYDFSFEQFVDRFDYPIMNEAGSRDIWPILAQISKFGYGSTGTFGFRRPGVYDSWHDGGHSDKSA